MKRRGFLKILGAAVVGATVTKVLPAVPAPVPPAAPAVDLAMNQYMATQIQAAMKAFAKQENYFALYGVPFRFDADVPEDSIYCLSGLAYVTEIDQEAGEITFNNVPPSNASASAKAMWL